MTDDFEDHCWKDVISPEVLDVYACYKRKMFVGPNAALLAIDLYEVVYRGGAAAAAQARQDPSEFLRRIRPCRDRADQAAVRRRARSAACRSSIRPATPAPKAVRTSSPPPSACGRRSIPSDYVIRPEFKPQPGDVVITKQRASVFFGTPLMAHLTQLGIQTLIVCGESTSGCVRATAVDAYSNGFHVVLVEECCFDRSQLSHKVNLFDMHHKYTDVMHVDEVVAHLEVGMKVRKAS